MATVSGAQVVEVTEEHTYVLNIKELDKLLLNDNIKDLPVVVVSVAGAYRGGKSFLLNFFLRYLRSSESARNDGSWLGEDSQPLEGFKWRSGIVRTTTGILMWGEPFITTLPTGEKVAILLMDTQGTFDNKSTVRDCSTIFALSTLLSSVQIYNLSQNIQEDDLQHLQLFTEYGKMVKEQGSKAFQVLEFLVRDWQFPEDFPYGSVGGETLLKDRLQITANLPKEMQDLRQHIHSSFEKISCFLMPHPGFKVLRKSFTGKIADIDIDFRTQLISLVKSLFGPEKLLPKTINGQRVKARDMHNYFKTYMKLFNSDEIPSPTSIMKATVEAGLLSAVNEAREKYEKGMDDDCGPKQPSVPPVDLQILHTQRMTEACNFFTNKKKMGSLEEHNKYLDKLKKELDQRLPQFVQSNLAKIQQAINKAKEAYEDAIILISKDQSLCVHPLDLEKVHTAGVAAAIASFDKARKRITNKPDDERTKFIQSFEKRYSLLRLSNERNNEMVVSELTMKYWQYMQTKCALDPPLADREFKEEHEGAREKALQDFETRRSMPSAYTEDVFKYKLTTSINDNFIQLKSLNKSKNKAAMEAAIREYDNYMKSILDKDKCLHPTALERENQNGVCRALVALRPRNQCSDGFDPNDEDETTLKEILKKRYNAAKSINDAANEAALQEAYNVYVSTMDDLSRPTLWWLLIVPIFIDLSKRGQNHEEAKARARETFFSKRRDGSSGSSDSYSDRLEQSINDNFIQLKSLNKSKNKAAMEAAIREYDNYMKSILDKDKCLHPTALERENQNGVCRALVALRPRNQCSDGFDPNDEDETTLKEILKKRYNAAKSINDAANEAALQEAYNVYVSTMDDLSRPTLWWLLIVPIFIDLSKRGQNHEEAKARARETFFSKRRDGSSGSSDSYSDRLEQLMDNYYKQNY